MKQHITPDQLNELSEKGKTRLITWWQPEIGDKYLDWGDEVFYGQGSGFEDETHRPDKVYFKDSAGEGKEKDLPLLSVGQMIEFLVETVGLDSDDFGRLVLPGGYLDDSTGIIVDDLWTAVKEVLEK